MAHAPRAILAVLLLSLVAVAGCLGGEGTESTGEPGSVGIAPPPATTVANDVGVKLVEVLSGLQSPILVAPYAGKLVVGEQVGRLRTATCTDVASACTLDAAPLLDIRDRVEFGGEQGLLGAAFRAGPASTPYFVHYSARGDGRTVIARFTGIAEERILEVDQPYSNHNGGTIAFGPGPGYLFVGLGDGGDRDDPAERAQDKDSLLGKMLRLDVSGPTGYSSPADNPFVGKAGRDEVYMTGLRNPWRFSLDVGGPTDAGAGDFWIADVGQDHWEEVNHVPVGKASGANLGWDVWEANHHHEGPTSKDGYVFPVAEYSHDEGCSVTGGHVYRGSAIRALSGKYLYGDYCSGKIWTFDEGKVALLLDTDANISSFGVDANLEMYVVDHGSGNDGKVYRIVAD